MIGNNTKDFSCTFSGKRALSPFKAHCILQLLFWIGVLRYIELPGLYMDAVNPDYHAALWLNPEYQGPQGQVPSIAFMVLSVLYHGVQNYYVDMPLVWFFGCNIVTLRIAQALFGAVIISLVFSLLSRLTKSFIIAFGFAAILATDIAFIASFRTQFYMVIAGDLWVLASLLCLVSSGIKLDLTKRRLVASGFFYALSLYSYFIYICLLPVYICLFLPRIHFKDFKKYIFCWAAGVLIGWCITYGLALVFLVLAKGSFSEAWKYIRSGTKGHAPLSGQMSIADAVSRSILIAKQALNNEGNELMIYGKQLSSVLGNIKLYILAILLFLASLSSVFIAKQVKSGRRHLVFLSVLFPAGFVLASVFFGKRIWVHHSSLLVPLSILAIAMFIFIVKDSLFAGHRGSRIANLVIGALILFFLICNIAHQQSFFNKLDTTGGVKYYSDAINLMAADALHEENREVIYLFPEWGFFMPFTYLTGNKVRCDWGVTREKVQSYLKKNYDVRLAYWDLANEQKYRGFFVDDAESSFTVERKAYFQRDGKPAFYILK